MNWGADLESAGRGPLSLCLLFLFYMVLVQGCSLLG
jgi:hypothetical protein